MPLKLVIVVSFAVACVSGQVCPAKPGWLLTSTGCYFSQTNSSSVEALPYSQALSYCQSQGAQLTSVSSLKENLVVVNLCGGNNRCYIGLYLSAVGDLTSSFWTDGSTSTYRNWNATAPTGGGSCTVIGKYNGTGVFEDDDCNGNRSFICKLFSTYANCQDALSSGVTSDGVYVIAINSTNLRYASCDMTTAGGGWLVFQRRKDGSVNFYRNWTDYVNGFGSPSGEYWFGLENISQLTVSTRYLLRVDMADLTGQTAYEEYDNFVVNGASTNYTMTSLGQASGTAGDAMKAPTASGCGGSGQATLNMAFTTFDADHDSWSASNCALQYKGGWWYGSCHSCNPNGLYLNGTTSQYATGDVWCPWKGYYYALKTIEMKIRPYFVTTTAAPTSSKAPTTATTIAVKTTTQVAKTSSIMQTTRLTTGRQTTSGLISTTQPPSTVDVTTSAQHTETTIPTSLESSFASWTTSADHDVTTADTVEWVPTTTSQLIAATTQPATSPPATFATSDWQLAQTYASSQTYMHDNGSTPNDDVHDSNGSTSGSRELDVTTEAVSLPDTEKLPAMGQTVHAASSTQYYSADPMNTFLTAVQDGESSVITQAATQPTQNDVSTVTLVNTEVSEMTSETAALNYKQTDSTAVDYASVTQTTPNDNVSVIINVITEAPDESTSTKTKTSTYTLMDGQQDSSDFSSSVTTNPTATELSTETDTSTDIQTTNTSIEPMSTSDEHTRHYSTDTKDTGETDTTPTQSAAEFSTDKFTTMMTEDGDVQTTVQSTLAIIQSPTTTNVHPETSTVSSTDGSSTSNQKWSDAQTTFTPLDANEMTTVYETSTLTLAMTSTGATSAYSRSERSSWTISSLRTTVSTASTTTRPEINSPSTARSSSSVHTVFSTGPVNTSPPIVTVRQETVTLKPQMFGFDQCVRPVATVFASVLITHNSIGTVASYVCPVGFHLEEGGVVRTLTCVDGSWPDSKPICRPVRCPGGNGGGLGDQSAAFSDIANGTCNVPDRTTDGMTSYVSKCSVQRGNIGIWSGTAFDCGERRCSPPPYVPNAVSTFNQTARSFSIKCLSGFRLPSGYSFQVHYCRADGSWNTVENCQVFYCPALSAPLNGKLSTDAVIYDTLVVVTCHVGFRQPDGSRAVYVRCNDSAEWNDTFSDCEPTVCNATSLPVIPGASISLMTGVRFPYGTMALFSCVKSESRFEDGTSETNVTCSDGGLWAMSSPVVASCGLHRCPPVPFVQNAAPDSLVSLNSSVVGYTCFDGFTLSDPSTASVVCQNGSTWSTPTPQCQKLRCRTLASAHQTLSTTDTLWGSTVQVYCNVGYQVNGLLSATFHCNSTGQWSPYASDCSPVDCGLHAIIPNAARSRSSASATTFLSNITFSCNVGFWFEYNVFEFTSTCMSNGRWSIYEQYQACTAVRCPLLLFRTVNTTETTIGTVVNVSCPVSGRKSPSLIITVCSKRGEWVPSVPNCNSGDQSDVRKSEPTESSRSTLIGVVTLVVVILPIALIALSDVAIIGRAIILSGKQRPPLDLN